MSVRKRTSYASGVLAETIAAIWLQLKGYRIVARRMRTPVGEIDLIARRGPLLVFVEVKARPTLPQALEALQGTGRGRILRAAEWYLTGRGQRDVPCRFDLVALSWRGQIRHVADAWGQA